MSELDDILAADLAATAFDADDPACPYDDASYLPAGGAATAVKIALEPATSDQGIDSDATTERIYRRGWLLLSASAISEPAVNDQLTIDGATWGVIAVEQLTPAAARLLLGRLTPIDRTTRGATTTIPAGAAGAVRIGR
jgi:hypothetical protein